jgi:hypothetical protein
MVGVAVPEGGMMQGASCRVGLGAHHTDGFGGTAAARGDVCLCGTLGRTALLCDVSVSDVPHMRGLMFRGVVTARGGRESRRRQQHGHHHAGECPSGTFDHTANSGLCAKPGIDRCPDERRKVIVKDCRTLNRNGGNSAFQNADHSANTFREDQPQKLLQLLSAAVFWPQKAIDTAFSEFNLPRNGLIFRDLCYDG